VRPFFHHITTTKALEHNTLVNKYQFTRGK